MDDCDDQILDHPGWATIAAPHDVSARQADVATFDAAVGAERSPFEAQNRFGTLKPRDSISDHAEQIALNRISRFATSGICNDASRSSEPHKSGWSFHCD